jgi:hypothetical protein
MDTAGAIEQRTAHVIYRHRPIKRSCLFSASTSSRFDGIDISDRRRKSVMDPRSHFVFAA